MTIPNLLFVFDVESIGLHGEGFAVGGGTYKVDGTPIKEFCFACDPNRVSGTSEDRKWVTENIPTIKITHIHRFQIRDLFWNEWMDAKKEGAIMVVDCGWPVEANFLRMCVRDKESGRIFEGPYPMHELATLLLSAGMDPIGEFDRLPNELPRHDPLMDARQSARMASIAIKRILNLDPAADSVSSSEDRNPPVGGVI